MKNQSLEQMIVGRKPVLEALKAGTQVDRIILLSGVHGKEIETIRELARKKNVVVDEADDQQFRKLAGDATTQGIVALVQKHVYASLDSILTIAGERNQKGFVLILDEIKDPHNLGALIRTAECAGAHGVIIPKHHSASITTTVTKTSAGATEHIAVAEVTNIVNTIEILKEKGYWVVGMDEKAEKLYTEVDYKSAIAVVVGNEGRGIRRLVQEHCDFVVKIPLYGKIESLNASVAGGLVMFEVMRQRVNV